MTIHFPDFAQHLKHWEGGGGKLVLLTNRVAIKNAPIAYS